MGGGCRLPLGARATPGAGGRLTLRAVIATPDGRRVVRASAAGRASNPDGLAERVYRMLMRKGGRKVLRELKRGGG
jgi:hydroxymethylbilane synthase